MADIPSVTHAPALPAASSRDVRIDISIRFPDGEVRSVSHIVAERQAQELIVPEKPVSFPMMGVDHYYAIVEWQRKVERADRFASMIATGIALTMVRSLGEKKGV